MQELRFNLSLPVEPSAAGPSAAGGAPEMAGASFERDLGKAVNAVDELQLDADKQSDLVAHGAGNLHEVAISLEKADVAMRLAMKVRNKVVDAYNEIMRMSV